MSVENKCPNYSGLWKTECKSSVLMLGDHRRKFKKSAYILEIVVKGVGFVQLIEGG